MEFLSPGYFDEHIAIKIKELLNIDIEKSEYSSTACSVNLLEKPNPFNPFLVIIQGQLAIEREGLLLYWLDYTYTYDGNKEKDNCVIKVKEAFPEHLELFNMPCLK